jgi:hypothetical protein
MASFNNLDRVSTRPHSNSHIEKQTTGEVDTSRRRCWECVRRRRVCDLSRPECTKCQQAGLVCTGYGVFKPVTWLPVGKVKSKVPIRKKCSKTLVHQPATSKGILDKSSDAGMDCPAMELSRFTPRDLISDVVHAGNYCKYPAAVVILL